MTEQRCLFCYEPLADDRRDFHPACSRKFFGTADPPQLPYDLQEIHTLAEEVVRSSVSVTGVQAKLSLDLSAASEAGKKKRLTIVGLWGRYVLKPPSADYPSLPENEDLTMHLAELFGIRTVPHTLIRLHSGELAYLTRRIDRPDGAKLAMEDMCQLTGRLTEDKYKGSLEQVGKVVRRFSENRGFDLLELFRLTLFCYLTGNSDMHLKNFSLLRAMDGLVSLAPAYDLLATALVLPEDQEESALTVNGKKRKLTRDDFSSLAGSFDVGDVVLRNTFEAFADALPAATAFLSQSFLGAADRTSYAALLARRSALLGLRGTS
jgi:serine/threonine-protein kinase HipA